MMEPNMPRDEAQWREWLSAYLDGELALEEREEIEAELARDPQRARQLEELRRLGGLLQAWTVEAPEPSPALLRGLNPRGATRRPRREGWLEGLRRALLVPWPVAAALFMAGVLAGAGGLHAIQGGRPAGPRVVVVNAAPPVAVTEASAGPVISEAQAAVLRREMQAAGLRDRVLRELDRRNYAAAARGYQELMDNYRDSAALRQLLDNPALRTAAQRLQTLGRI